MPLPITEINDGMRILGIFYDPKTLDCYTFVTNNQTRPGYYEMLGTDKTGSAFSQFTEGSFHYHGDNSHLGKPVQWRDIPERLQKHVEERLKD